MVSVEPGEVYISGTEYAVGPDATPTTVVVGGETVIVGFSGDVLPSTTIAAPTQDLAGGIGSFFAGGASSSCITASGVWARLLALVVSGSVML